MFKIIFFLIPLFLDAEFDNTSNGFGMDIGSSGSGFFLIRQYSNYDGNFAFNSEVRFYDIKAENETIIYDYYSGQYQAVSGKSLFMTPIFFGLNYYPFIGKIENNFSPFLTARSGFVLIFDGKDNGNFKNRWSDPTFESSIGGFIGCGIDFKYIRKSYISAMFGYEFLPSDPSEDSSKLTSNSNYTGISGILIHIAINRNLR